MSLKGVHIVFIIAAVMVALFFSWWAWQKTLPAASALALLFALSLIIYGAVFFRKMRI